ncbi:hypothetical protein DUNSADRAFT_3569 [Dunaliella salina]|uniref:Uncharacterized protein n=1 Tax=Dunaliella salina TaxID=3046 RepID=A0ABQ7H7Z6_DUNSA|nr:hypothetical protein DUNSADRAFT_3569 [Dunaliella salina]|eukprot:KAF5842976.1 hypothetical protein DUNSADRAFT_3569 [Dunaliella salina]
MGHTEILARAGLSGTAAHQLPPGPRSHLYDVYGQPRAAPPPLPRTYKEEQADVALNTRHIAVEGDVLRAPGSHTSSGSLLRASGKAGRQFALSPPHIHFGSVALGSVAHAHARLRNISTGPARFTVDRPSLPLRVIHKPGALAAGMETLLTVELVAETPGDFVGEIVVRSELNVLVLSISAKIVEVHPQAANAKGGAANTAPPSGNSAAPGGTDRASSAGSKKGIQQQPQVQQQQEGQGVPVLDEQQGLDAMQAQPA